ncbi:signal transducer CD24 [Physeter macrocephalus]|uniref:Signal transducer CD24 n=1 Tax=Physeter macrocephalus TaxID=9755 RepID=A0A455BNF8_PHYMC|nr:signal transducer CD24 [Physeter catodon]|eukprot:XP_028350525.1 signal transducer CD24 [Physeter catodon]
MAAMENAGAACQPGRPAGEGHARAGALFPSPGPARRPPSPPCLRPPGATGPSRTPPPVRRAAHRRSGHGQSDGGQARTGAAASGTALTCAVGVLFPGSTRYWIYSNQTTVVTPPSNSSQHTSAAPNPANATTKASDGALQSTASLLVISVSLLHLYC